MQQYGIKHFAVDTFSARWSKVKDYFLNYVMLHIKLNEMEHRAHASTYYVLTHSLSPYDWNIFFLKVVILPTKGKEAKNTTQSNNLSLHTHPRPLGLGQKVKTFLFLKAVMLHFKLKGIERRSPSKHMFCFNTQPRPRGWVKRSNIFVLNVVMLHIKLKGKKYMYIPT